MAFRELSNYCLVDKFYGTNSRKKDLFLPTAKDVWDVVRDTYSSQIFELKTKSWKSRQRDRDVTTYYNEIVTLWQELDLCYEDEWDAPQTVFDIRK